MNAVWTSYAGSVSSELLDDVEDALENIKAQVDLLRYMRKSEVETDLRIAEHLKKEWASEDKHAPAIVDKAHTPGKENRHYLRPGDAVDNLVECIAASPRTVVFLSEAYFLSPYCLSEFACLLYRSHSMEPLIVDQYAGDLHKVLTLHQLVACKVPGGKVREMSLDEALCRTLEARYPEIPEDSEGKYSDRRREIIVAALNRISKSLDAKADSSEVADSIKSLSEQNAFEGELYEATNNFKRWCNEDRVAELVCLQFDLRDCCDEIVGQSEIDPKLHVNEELSTLSRTQCKQFSIYAALETYRRVRSHDPQQWRLFVETLSGFLALPLVGRSVKASLAVAPGGAQFIPMLAGDGADRHRWLKVGLARASLYGSGIRLSLVGSKSDLPLPPDLVEIAQVPSTPDQLGVTVRGLTKSLWAIANLRHENQFDGYADDPDHPTGLDLTQRGALRNALNRRRMQCGSAAFALTVSPSTFKNCNGWSRVAHELLVALNDRGVGKVPEKFSLDVLVSQERSDAIDVLPFDTDDRVYQRFGLIQEVLQLA